jgi:hypothetical protein
MDTFCEIFKENSTGPVWVQTAAGSLVRANINAALLAFKKVVPATILLTTSSKSRRKTFL